MVSPGERVAARALESHEAQGALMAIGVEPERVRICLAEPVQGRYRLIGWVAAPRRPEISIAGQAAGLCRELGRRLRRTLWHDTARIPFLLADDPLRYPPLEHLAVTLTPVPRLRVAVVGLTRSQSTEFAATAVASGPAQLVYAQSYAPGVDAQDLAHALVAQRVDVLLLAGGHDRAPAMPSRLPYALAAYVAAALQQMQDVAQPVVLFAGSGWAAPHVEKILGQAGSRPPLMLANVLPSPTHVRQDNIAQALHSLYAVQAQQTPGYAELAAWSNSGQPPTTLESNFARLVRAWCDLQGLDDLHGLYTLGNQRLHVWATRDAQTIRLRYVTVPDGGPDTSAPVSGAPVELPETGTGGQSLDVAHWPPVDFLCGVLPRGQKIPHSVTWWDRGALGPLVAALGATAPQAVRQLLETDVMLPPEIGGARVRGRPA